jgi:hypothetical protein
MKHSHAERTGASPGVSARNIQRLKNAIARRKLQEMQDEKILRSWLAEVWEQSNWSDGFDRNSRLH